MSSTLSEAIAARGPRAYVISVSETGPHTGFVDVAGVDEGRMQLALGQSDLANSRANPNLSLLWPPPGSDLDAGYSLLVNVVVERHAGEVVSARVTKVVEHRPAPAPAGAPGPCRSDCVVLKAE